MVEADEQLAMLVDLERRGGVAEAQPGPWVLPDGLDTEGVPF